VAFGVAVNVPFIFTAPLKVEGQDAIVDNVF
jgi:hypothetical protein